MMSTNEGNNNEREIIQNNYQSKIGNQHHLSLPLWPTVIVAVAVLALFSLTGTIAFQLLALNECDGSGGICYRSVSETETQRQIKIETLILVKNIASISSVK